MRSIPQGAWRRCDSPPARVRAGAKAGSRPTPGPGRWRRVHPCRCRPWARARVVVLSEIRHLGGGSFQIFWNLPHTETCRFSNWKTCRHRTFGTSHIPRRAGFRNRKPAGRRHRRRWRGRVARGAAGVPNGTSGAVTGAGGVKLKALQRAGCDFSHPLTGTGLDGKQYPAARAARSVPVPGVPGVGAAPRPPSGVRVPARFRLGCRRAGAGGPGAGRGGVRGSRGLCPGAWRAIPRLYRYQNNTAAFATPRWCDRNGRTPEACVGATPQALGLRLAGCAVETWARWRSWLQATNNAGHHASESVIKLLCPPLLTSHYCNARVVSERNRRC
jgi:hypothetical protein